MPLNQAAWRLRVVVVAVAAGGPDVTGPRALGPVRPGPIGVCGSAVQHGDKGRVADLFRAVIVPGCASTYSPARGLPMPVEFPIADQTAA